MTTQQAINELAKGNRSDEAIKTVAQAMADKSRRGEWYDGPNSTNVYDWVAEGDYTSGTTLSALVAEWDN